MLKSISLVLIGIVLGVGLTLLAFRIAPAHGSLESRMVGVWKGSAHVAGSNVTLSLVLEANGSTLSGRLSARPGGAGSFERMTVDPGGNLSFDLQIANQSVSFTGKVVPNARAMSGDLTTSSYGPGTWSLTKQS
jgi:hypothetical protein